MSALVRFPVRPPAKVAKFVISANNPNLYVSGEFGSFRAARRELARIASRWRANGVRGVRLDSTSSLATLSSHEDLVLTVVEVV